MSSARDFFGLAAINFCHAAPEMFRLFLWRQLARQLPDLGGQTAALGFGGIIELLSLAGGLSHNVKLFDLAAKCKLSAVRNSLSASIGESPPPPSPIGWERGWG